MRVMRTANIRQGNAFLVLFVPLFRFSPKGYELGNIFGRILSFFCRIIKSTDKEKTLQITEFVVFYRCLALHGVAYRGRERNLYSLNFMLNFNVLRLLNLNVHLAFHLEKMD